MPPVGKSPVKNLLLMLSSGEPPHPWREVSWHHEASRTLGITYYAISRNIRGLEAGKSVVAFYGNQHLDHCFLGRGVFEEVLSIESNRGRSLLAESELYQLFGRPPKTKFLLGLSAFASERRTKEIGIRKVMGASIPDIMVLLSKDFTLLVVIAFVVAVPIGYGVMHRWLQVFAYRIDIGFSHFLVVGLAVLLIAWATISFQSIKAALTNPVESLRYE